MKQKKPKLQVLHLCSQCFQLSTWVTY